ncbi:MAG TPA: hypothetical protein VN903_16155 [Polyangia bacterium]|jgi:hypothetical protein|nr:hypothetical protein [Polyangia bacterium]
MHRPGSHESIFGLAGLALAALSGCAALMPGGAHRSEQFAAGNAPEPTISTTVLSCVAKSLPFGSGDAYTAQFNALARAAMPAPPVPLSPSATSVLCNTVAASGAFHAYRETTPPASAVAIIRELAQATGAKSIAVPAMRLYARCEQDQKTVHDSAGRVIATVDEGTQTCRMDRFKDVGLFLFAADGTILYRSTKQVGNTSNTDPEPDMNTVLAGIPATFSAAAGGGAVATEPASPTMAAPAGATRAAYTPPAPAGVGPTDPKVDEAIGEVNPKAPADCKKYVKTVCRATSIPDNARLQMCAAYVGTVNNLVTQQGAKSGETCKSMMPSAPR